MKNSGTFLLFLTSRDTAGDKALPTGTVPAISGRLATMRLQADDERTPTHCSIIIGLRLNFVYAEVYAFKVTSM